jgi:hypothetical protein
LKLGEARSLLSSDLKHGLTLIIENPEAHSLPESVMNNLELISQNLIERGVPSTDDLLGKSISSANQLKQDWKHHVWALTDGYKQGEDD